MKKEPKLTPHDELIQAFRVLFNDDYFRYVGEFSFLPGNEVWGEVKVGIDLDRGHDEKSLRISLDGVSVNEDQQFKDGHGAAGFSIEPSGAYLWGCMMVGYALAQKDRGEYYL
jgi:hypothetical protein